MSTEGPLQDAINAQEAQVQRDLSDAKARLAVNKARIQDQLAHRPKRPESVTDVTFDNRGRIVGPVRTISKWNDGRGYLVYTETGESLQTVGHSQIQPLSERIQAQQAVFKGLDSTEQKRIRAGFRSGDKTIDTKPYSAYLQNELLGNRFEKLKQNPPRPFGNK